MSLIHPVLYVGQKFVGTAADKRGVILSNAISLSLLGLSLILFVFYYIWFDWNFVTIAIPCVGLLACVSILLNALGHTHSSRVWICLLIPSLITALSIYSKQIYYANQEELDYFTFRFIVLGTCSFPWIFFSIREKKYLIGCAMAGLSILMLFDPLHSAFGVGYNKPYMAIEMYYFTNIVIFISYCILISALAFLKWVSEKNEQRSLDLIEELHQANELLTEKNAEIEAQSAELQAQSDVLQNNQKDLVNAYDIIQEQKERLFSKNQLLSTELLAKNKDLTDTNSELIKHNNELRQFSYTVSHNLRGPVASLLGLVDLVAPEKFQPEDAEVMQHIRIAAENLDTIIKDLTKIIDIRHDIFKIRQKIILQNEVHDTVQLLQKDVHQHNIEIRTNFTACPHIYSVKPMVHSILYNLLSNAIKYRSPERPPVIEVSARESDRYTVLEVRDNGMGMDLKQHKDNIFKLYKRFHFHTEGKGLGLYLVKLQAEALGGTVDVESELNRFTTFKVYLRKPDDVERQILYKEPYAEIFFDARLNATGVIWSGPVTGEQYRHAYRKCLDFVKTYNSPNYIADISRQGHIEDNELQWMLDSILPEATRNGLRRIATIQHDAEDEHVQQYIRRIAEQLLTLNIISRHFRTFQEATAWLEQENEDLALKNANTRR
jgi:signal transduction histidine kinase